MAKHLWKKGESGNPDGKPKDPFRALIREATHNGNDLVSVAMRILNKSKSDKMKLKAIDWLSDRGWGKAVQPISGTDGDGNFIPIQVQVINYASPTNPSKLST